MPATFPSFSSFPILLLFSTPSHKNIDGDTGNSRHSMIFYKFFGEEELGTREGDEVGEDFIEEDFIALIFHMMVQLRTEITAETSFMRLHLLSNI